MSRYQGCPRCGERSLEVLHSYSHCVNCLYAEDRYESLESHYLKALKEIKAIEPPKATGKGDFKIQETRK